MPGTDSDNNDKGRPAGDGEYEVQEGDCLESIAARSGHYWETIWNHPGNASLKQARESPNVLLPGDRLHIPPRQLAEYDRPTDARHSFVLRGRPSKLRLRVLEGGEPRANEPYRLRVDNRLYEGTTDGGGNIEVAIPPDAAGGELVVGRGRVRQRVYPLQLGGMDPITSVSGIQKRLRNLGYPCPPSGQMDDETAAAIAFFQRDRSLQPTGALDEATRQKFMDAHAS